MKKLLSIVVLIFMAGYAQAQVVSGTTSYLKVNRPALVGTFNYTTDVVEAAIAGDLKTKGFGKGDNAKGFKKYPGIHFPEISSEKLDLYYKVERNGGKNSGSSRVTLMLSKGYDNFISEATDPAIMDAARNYLTNLIGQFDKQKLLFDIDEQQKLVSTVEKKYNSLVSDEQSIKKRIEGLQNDLTKNQQDQATQKELVEKEKVTLETLKAKLK